MVTRYVPPRHVSKRNHPTAHAIAAALLTDRAVLNLPRWMVIADIRARFPVADATARTAFAIARRTPSMTSSQVEKAEPHRRPMASCGACGGTGRIHVQHKRPFRVESRECDCWRVVELAEECDRALKERDRLQGGVP